MAKRYAHRWDQVGSSKWVCRYCRLTRVLSARMGRVGRPLFFRKGNVASLEKLPPCESPEDAGQTGLLDPERFE